MACSEKVGIHIILGSHQPREEVARPHGPRPTTCRAFLGTSRPGAEFEHDPRADITRASSQRVVVDEYLVIVTAADDDVGVDAISGERRENNKLNLGPDPFRETRSDCGGPLLCLRATRIIITAKLRCHDDD
ncbi:MAG: hypothetical protein A2289_17585 [Deltaproteobacteria bacterium RIFOXYA12_FULL_58_15]|nr:MAG: hypothetical protein A2289_17585 [Deltaproteobacteria bacterium RIFOXYA12_FULL_58_15]OGR10626.1 MAG: hypothetical protein A2341_01025 [Deltaproteobacteria bacterium RIFOXYB12_FULL_58_9]